ncbi:hypothetical protein SmJEL517_g04145 [Synchytrium microbalum]|uniref:3-oxoacyl-[acyl-carrier-protein] reductase n=1 Tax=Synchytrium microbalum TaxID=1806994 RepID=A0A507BVB3_9FUNG|nr:uncharacterized protein SmJEL517_g04145 [Synchytrium microbalum]TPX32837.1 hypothetical protein SmJEL517_g04145 [Synchytrium microbalum]
MNKIINPLSTINALNAKVALVTGSSRGIGAAIAVHLAIAGCNVAIHYNSNRETALQVKDLCLKYAPNAKIIVLDGDIEKPDENVSLVARTEAQLGPIDILVLNAGIGFRESLLDIKLETFTKVMNVNLTSQFTILQKVIPGMISRKFGRIVLVSSVAAFTGGVVGPHYASSKAAQIGLMHSVAANHAKFGITCNIIAPALIDGGMSFGDPNSNEVNNLKARIPANASSKKIASQNATTLQYHLYAILLTALAYILIRFLIRYSSFRFSHILGFVILEAVIVGLYTQLVSLSNDSGVDLSDTNSLVAYYFDVIYVCMFVLVGSACLSDWVWYLLWVIPLFAIWKLWDKVIKPFVISPSAKEPVKTKGKGVRKPQR